MLELVLEQLKSFDGLEWLVRETKTRRLESYNIKKQSEMRREVETTKINLVVYSTFSEDGKRYRGSCNTEIHPDSTPDEIRAKIESGLGTARFVKNEWFPLVEPSPAGAAATPGAKTETDAVQALEDLQVAFYSGDNRDGGHLSYSEFFITRNEERVLNSRGVDVSYATYNLFAETAVHWRGLQEKEIEILESYQTSLPMAQPSDTSAACDMLKDRVARLFDVAEKKAAAQPTPQVGDINVLLTGECLAEFFDYYLSCANAEMVYRKLSTFKEGSMVQGAGDTDCDRLTLTLEPKLEGSSYGRPYDEHGLPLDSHVIIENGKLLKYSGSTRFSSYLNIPPTGNIYSYRVTGGTATGEDLRRDPYLELVSFSDFQTDPITGDFGSEIRLGFYFDGEKTVPVTGGSISGNMAAVQDSLRMSAEERQHDRYRGPETILIRGASISGVGDQALDN